jgi:hypothetical protein
MKATTRPCRAGQLMNHRHANSVVTTGLVASRHAMPRRGSKIKTTTTPKHVLTPGQDRLACKPSLLASPSLGLTTTRSVEPFSICNMAPKLYKEGRPPIQGDGLLRLHSGIRSPHSSYLFPLAYTPYCKNFRAFNRRTRTRTLSKTERRAPV